MKVNFKRDWSYSDGRFRQRDNPNQVPDSFAKLLPSDAEIVEEIKSKPKAKIEVKPSKSFFKKEDK